MSKFHLVLLIHAHQPVGNFDAVFEKIYQCSYLPFLECLERHPNVRLGLHYSGPLFEWLEKRHPEFLERLREMVGCAQVEMVGGGFFEPILISLPPEDQAEQLRSMSDYLVRRFGVTPAGAWLAERVWEPQLPYMLSSCDLRYTLVDDIHFLAAGIDPEQLHGDYLAEDRGRVVRVLPGLKFLRYFVPFHSVEETMEVLHASAARHPGGMAAMGDDCEKFGGWPGTYDHCYRDGWLDRFFGAIEASGDWLVATPPGEYIAAHAPLGRAGLPTASYPEMMEWALPTAARNEYHALSKEFAGRPSVLRFLRGGHWRGFFSKYAEANLMHKKMLYVSAKLRKAASRRLVREKQAKLARARKHLMRAQCNDAYWHGIFGGIYAPNLRTEIWRELVRAETLTDKVSSSTGRVLRLERLDFNADGCEELYVTSRRMAALVQPAEGGTIGALDFRTKGVTFLNSMQRRVEAYHGRLRDVSRGKPGQVASIHEQVRVKEEGLERALHYDRWPRHSFRLLLFPAEKTFEDYQSLRLEEHAGLLAAPMRFAKPNPAESASRAKCPPAPCRQGRMRANCCGALRIFGLRTPKPGTRSTVPSKSAPPWLRRAECKPGSRWSSICLNRTGATGISRPPSAATRCAGPRRYRRWNQKACICASLTNGRMWPRPLMRRGLPNYGFRRLRRFRSPRRDLNASTRDRRFWPYGSPIWPPVLPGMEK